MIFAAIIGDYCSEYMPIWYCTLFQSPTLLFLQTLVLVSILIYARRSFVR